MSRFDAIFLHGVTEYSRNASLPDVPDFKSLQSRLSDAETWAGQLDDGLASDISGIASDFDFDSSLSDYVGNSEEKIQSFHAATRNMLWQLKDSDYGTMTKDQMVDLLSSLYDQLIDIAPNDKSFNDMMRGMWVAYPASSALASFSFLNRMWMSATRDDHYVGYVHGFEERGSLKVDMYTRGSLRMELLWTPATLIFTSDQKIAMFDGVTDNKTFAMDVYTFRSFFVDWLRPTEEEIALFDVIHPGADWQVLRYLRDYDAMLSAKVEEPTRRLVSVCTTL